MRIVYKMHPLQNHPFAQVAAQAALAAQEQGKFVEMHELLLSRFREFNQRATQTAAALELAPERARSLEVQEAMFLDFAEELGLDKDRFLADLRSPSTKSRIAEESREVVAIGATGTPASFVNGRYLRGAQPYQSFKALVDRALKGSGGAAQQAASP